MGDDQPGSGRWRMQPIGHPVSRRTDKPVSLGPETTHTNHLLFRSQ